MKAESKVHAQPEPVQIDDQPGHYIRRLHQISVAIFLQETEPHGVTPVQYAALQTVNNQPGVDQRTLARAIGLDTSTVAGVVAQVVATPLEAHTHEVVIRPRGPLPRG